MKTNYLLFAMLLFLGFATSCNDDDGPTIGPTGNEMTYTLYEKDVEGIMGTATFIENTDNSVTINLDIMNTPSGGMHPAHIHFNTAAEGGDIALTLGTVNGDTGMSTITASQWDNGTPFNYDDLLDFDGYINVHLSADQLGTIVAQGDIGQNMLTGTEKQYMLNERDVDGIMGTATFKERVNGEALAVLMVENTVPGGMHPSHIHENTAAESGGIAFTFNPVNGDTGMSMTNLAMLDDDTMFGYEDVLDFDGYINVHLSADQLGTIVAQGDIGQNELTGESTTYMLDEKDVEGIMGTLMLEERMNGESLATLMVENTIPGEMHPSHIHDGSVATAPGGIAFTFNPVNGDTGMSMTNVAMLDNGTSVSYTDLLGYDGYVNVHLSADQLSVIVAQGNVGSNAN